jgi:hypothetical protein
VEKENTTRVTAERAAFDKQSTELAKEASADEEVEIQAENDEQQDKSPVDDGVGKMVNGQAKGESAATSSFDEQHRRATKPTFTERVSDLFRR